jgi:hypothetical protein
MKVARPMGFFTVLIAMKKDVIEGMWKGAPPYADNNIDIDLKDGTFRKGE